MKGVVFTELIEMVEAKFGYDTADTIIQNAAVPSGGAYTAVGLYDDSEMFALVGELSKHLKTPVSELLLAFGEHLFGRFAVLYPTLVEPSGDAFALMESIDEFIHVEVKKLYPDAQLPCVICKRLDDDTMVVDYQSHRPLGDFAEGLVRGVVSHYGNAMDISRRDLDSEKKYVEFTLKKQ